MTSQLRSPDMVGPISFNSYNRFLPAQTRFGTAKNTTEHPVLINSSLIQRLRPVIAQVLERVRTGEVSLFHSEGLGYIITHAGKPAMLKPPHQEAPNDTNGKASLAVARNTKLPFEGGIFVRPERPDEVRISFEPLHYKQPIQLNVSLQDGKMLPDNNNPGSETGHKDLVELTEQFIDFWLKQVEALESPADGAPPANVQKQPVQVWNILARRSVDSRA